MFSNVVTLYSILFADYKTKNVRKGYGSLSNLIFRNDSAMSPPVASFMASNACRITALSLSMIILQYMSSVILSKALRSSGAALTRRAFAVAGSASVLQVADHDLMGFIHLDNHVAFVVAFDQSPGSGGVFHFSSFV